VGQIRDNLAEHGTPTSFLTRVEAIGLGFSAHLQSSPEFFVGHIQVVLRLLNARMAAH
jgi:hypothetical protein